MKTTVHPTRPRRFRYWLLFIPLILILVACWQIYRLTEAGFLWSEWRFRSDREYITAAEPMLKKIIDSYPVTELQKKEANFEIYVTGGSIWEGDPLREKVIPQKARSNGKYVQVFVTPAPLCFRYGVEVYVSNQLDQTIKTRSDFGSPRYEGPYIDRDCPRKNIH